MPTSNSSFSQCEVTLWRQTKLMLRKGDFIRDWIGNCKAACNVIITPFLKILFRENTIASSITGSIVSCMSTSSSRDLETPPVFGPQNVLMLKSQPPILNSFPLRLLLHLTTWGIRWNNSIILHMLSSFAVKPSLAYLIPMSTWQWLKILHRCSVVFRFELTALWDTRVFQFPLSFS